MMMGERVCNIFICYVIIFCRIFCMAENSAKDSSCSLETDHNCAEEASSFIDYSLNELDQSDPKLIKLIKDKYLVSPKKKKRLNPRRKLTSQNLKGQYGQPFKVDEFFKGKKRNGFFIEAGASDGETLSNTLFFELKRNWTGLLIEPNPDFFQHMTEMNRNAHLLPHCLSTKSTPEVVNFDASALVGGIINEGRIKPGDIDRPKDYINRPYHRRTIKMQCFPLFSILKALGNPTVDYLSLDIEGAEFPVLKTIPFNEINIRLIGIEMNHIGKVFDGDTKKLVQYLDEQGYEYWDKTGIDWFFQKKPKRP